MKKETLEELKKVIQLAKMKQQEMNGIGGDSARDSIETVEKWVEEV